MSAWWRQRNARERALLVACVAVCIVAVWLVFTPSGSSRGKLLPAAAAREKFRAAEAEKTRLEQETSALRAAVEKAVFTDPPDRLLPKVVQRLQAIARESGVHVKEIKPARVRAAADVSKVMLNVRLGTVSFGRPVVTFLYRLEEPKEKLVVENLTITAPDPKARTVEVEVQVAMYTSGRGGADPKDGVATDESGRGRA